MGLGDNFWVSLCWMGVFDPWFLFSLGLLVFVICVSGDWQDLWSIKESPTELGGRTSDSYSGLWSIRVSLFFWLTHLAPKYGVSHKGGDGGAWWQGQIESRKECQWFDSLGSKPRASELLTSSSDWCNLYLSRGYQFNVGFQVWGMGFLVVGKGYLLLGSLGTEPRAKEDSRTGESLNCSGSWGSFVWSPGPIILAN